MSTVSTCVHATELQAAFVWPRNAHAAAMPRRYRIPDHFNDLNNEEYPGPVLDYPAEGVRIDLENGWGGHAVLLVGYNKKHGCGATASGPATFDSCAVGRRSACPLVSFALADGSSSRTAGAPIGAPAATSTLPLSTPWTLAWRAIFGSSTTEQRAGKGFAACRQPIAKQICIRRMIL